jgi:hypothetical protein
MNQLSGIHHSTFDVRRWTFKVPCPKLRGSVTPCETLLLMDLCQRLARRHFSHGDAETRRLIHRTEPKLRGSVTPWLRVKPCSCWICDQRLARRHFSHRVKRYAHRVKSFHSSDKDLSDVFPEGRGTNLTDGGLQFDSAHQSSEMLLSPAVGK